MWDGDVDRLHEIASCRCCCSDHTFEDCIARLWEGCRGSGTLTRQDIQKWADHYKMTLDEFWGVDTKTEY